MSKVCNTCSILLIPNENWKQLSMKTGWKICDTCRPLKVKHYNLKRNYGITLEDYNRMFEEQGGKCAICSAEDTGGKHKDAAFHVDHCHDTGKVRGLLCNQCNLALGKFKDSKKLLQKALDYLKKY